MKQEILLRRKKEKANLNLRFPLKFSKKNKGSTKGRDLGNLEERKLGLSGLKGKGTHLGKFLVFFLPPTKDPPNRRPF